MPTCEDSVSYDSESIWGSVRESSSSFCMASWNKDHKACSSIIIGRFVFDIAYYIYVNIIAIADCTK